VGVTNEPTPQEDIAWERKMEDMHREKRQKLEHDLFIEQGKAELALQRKLREEMAFLVDVLYPSEEEKAAMRERIRQKDEDAHKAGMETWW
jgi:hypothetical protein